MGFGTLFIGVFLLLNLSFFGFTDLLSGVIMLLAFYKLRGVNTYFKTAIYPTVAFCLIGLTELTQEILYLFGRGFDDFITYLHPMRFLLLGAIFVILHYAIRDVAKEVEVDKTAKRAKFCAVMSYPTFTLYAIQKIFSLFFEDQPLPLVIAEAVALLSLLVLLVITLITVYSAYMNICMPEDQNKEYVEKPSRFEFVNRFRKRQEEKNREYAEYKLSRMKKRLDRSKLKIKNKKK